MHICWKLEVTKRWEGEKKKGIPSAGSLPKWPQWSWLGHIEAKSPELLRHPPYGCRVPNIWTILLCFRMRISGEWDWKWSSCYGMCASPTAPLCCSQSVSELSMLVFFVCLFVCCWLFIMNGCWSLLNVFFFINWYDSVIVIFLSLLMPWVTLSEFSVLKTVLHTWNKYQLVVMYTFHTFLDSV